MRKETVRIHFYGLVEVFHSLSELVEINPTHSTISVVIDYIGGVVNSFSKCLISLAPITLPQIQTSQYRPRVTIVRVNSHSFLCPLPCLQRIIGIQIGFGHQCISIGECRPSLQDILQIMTCLLYLMLIIA